MTFTYSTTTLNTDLGKIRLIIGDTNSNDQILQDEEINYASTSTYSLREAAAVAAEFAAAKYARGADKTVGPLSISLSQKAEQMRALAATIRISSAAETLPFAGGISISRMDTVQEDTDRVETSFNVGMMDNPRAGDTT